MSTITNENIELECCICYEIIGEQNNCITPCGHKFCFVCMMKTLNINNTCPCCRTVLQEKEEEESEEEEEDTDYEDSDEEDSDYHYRKSLAPTENIASELESHGYTMSDILALYLGRISDRVNYRFIEKLNDDFDKIVKKQDSETESEHNETFDMMKEDYRRHNRRVPPALHRSDGVINLVSLFIDEFSN